MSGVGGGQSAENDARDLRVAADVIERFAAPGEDTPEFAALLDEFPDLPSRGNLKIILWRLAGSLREQSTSPGQAADR